MTHQAPTTKNASAGGPLILSLDPEPPTTGLLEAALRYAAWGLPVLPLVPAGKFPIGYLAPRGCHSASTNPKQIEWWWSRSPHANVGIATGTVIDVFDLDGPLAVQGWRQASKDTDGQERDLPGGPVVVTAHGEHHWFASTGHGNRCKFLPGCDWRGHDGLVVAPPSVHPDGHRYAWAGMPLLVEDPATGDYRKTPLWRSFRLPLQPAPDWLLEALSKAPADMPSIGPAKKVRRAPSKKTGLHGNDFGLRFDATDKEGEEEDRLHPVLFDAARRVACASKPFTVIYWVLDRESYRIGERVGRGTLDRGEAAAWLVFAAGRTGSDRQKNLAVITAGMSAALRGEAHDPYGLLPYEQKIDPFLLRQLGEIVLAAEGSRNDVLNRAAYSVGRRAGRGLLDRDDAVKYLIGAAGRAGPDLKKNRKTVASGLAAGIRAATTSKPASTGRVVA